MKTGERPQMLISMIRTHSTEKELKYICRNGFGRGIALMVVNPIFYER